MDADSANSTNCSSQLDEHATAILVTSVVISAVSISVAAVPAVAVFYLKYHKQFTYRVAFYQVLGAILYHCGGLLATLTPLSIGQFQKYFIPTCQLAAFSLTFFFWLKLFFVSFIVVHLFIFSIIYRSIKRFEPVYIVFSVVFSFLIAAIPLFTQTYGLAGAWCWIKNREDKCSTQTLLAGVIEQFTLYYVPGLGCLLVDSVMSITMLAILHVRVLREKKRDPSIRWHPLQEAIKQMLPLITYPVIFLLLLLPGLANRIYGALPNQSSVGLTFLSTISIALWGLVGGVTLSLHILVMRYSQRRKYKPVIPAPSYGTAEVGSTAVISVLPAPTSRTYFILPSESGVDGGK